MWALLKAHWCLVVGHRGRYKLCRGEGENLFYFIKGCTRCSYVDYPNA